MTKGLWIFPAIACIPLLIIGVTHHFWLGIVLYVFWFIRILCLKHKETLIMTVLINLLFCGALFFHQNRNQTKLDPVEREFIDRKSTRLNSSHVAISYAVFCLKRKN